MNPAYMILSVNHIRHEPTALATKNLEISRKTALDKAHERREDNDGTDSGKYDKADVKRCQSATSETGQIMLTRDSLS